MFPTTTSRVGPAAWPVDNGADKIDEIINGFDALEASYELMKISTLTGLTAPM